MVTSFNGDVTNLKLEQNGKSSLIMGIINHVAIVMTFSSTKISSSTTFYTITANTTINGVQAGTNTGGSTKGGYYVLCNHCYHSYHRILYFQQMVNLLMID
jgi:hypothetical protein